MEDSADNERRPAQYTTQHTTQSTTQYTTQKLTEAQNMNFKLSKRTSGGHTGGFK